AFAAAINLLAIGLSWKELRFASFDGDGARTSGIPAGRLQLMLMTLTAVTAVAAFEVLGSILVVAMIVVPGAAAHLLTDRLGRTMGLALMIGVASAGLGHLAANGLNAGLERVGWQPTVSSAAPMCVVLGGMLGAAMLLAPQRGFVAQAIDRVRLRARILDEDVLAALYRLQEHGRASATAADVASVLRAAPRGVRRSAARLVRSARIEPVRGTEYRLSEAGEELARRLVRSHRLWEAWLHETVGVAADHVHGTAHMMEHVTRGALRDELEAAAARDDRTDPHGREIP
ncbi:MAG: metal ABC transporter permease, partial [Phycisphaerales bacterium]